MTKVQKQRVKELAEQDCEIRHCYYSDDGKTCVIGKLLKAIGYDLGSLPKTDVITVIPNAIIALERNYGLSFIQCYNLQIANDGPSKYMHENDPIEDRRARVLSTLESFETTD